MECYSDFSAKGLSSSVGVATGFLLSSLTGVVCVQAEASVLLGRLKAFKMYLTIILLWWPRKGLYVHRCMSLKTMSNQFRFPQVDSAQTHLEKN